MASVIKVYKLVEFLIHQTQNGELNYDDFNLQSEVAEINMMGWLSGNPNANIQPTPFDTQKSRSWLSPALLPYKANVVNGKITKPTDFYYYDNMYSVSVKKTGCCDEEGCETKDEIEEIDIEILQGQQFKERARTYIKSLKPSPLKPISKEIGKEFEFLPKDLGSVTLEYYQYPSKYGKIVGKIDNVFNEEVPDTSLSQDYIWGDWSVPVLAYFILQAFGIHVRETQLFQMNEAKGKVPTP